MTNWIPAIQIISPIIIALAAYYFASKRYYKEKEYENVKQRYLENGLDKVNAAIRTAKTQILYNRTTIERFVYSVKKKNNLIESIDRLREDIQFPNSISLYDIPIEKIDKLFKNDLLNARIFEAIAIAHDQYNIIDRFLINSHSESGVLAIVLRKEHPEIAHTEIVKNNVDNLIENFEKDINSNYVRFHRIEPIFNFILTAIHKLERQRFSFSQLDNFHKDKDLCLLLDKTLKTI